MELIDYIKIAWKYKWVIVLVLGVSVSITGVVTLLIPPTYTATAKLQAGPVSSFFVSGYVSGSPGQKVDFSSYIELINDAYFKKEVLNSAKQSGNIDNVKLTSFHISAQPVGKTNFLGITAEAENAELAKILADASARALIKKTAEFESEAAKQTKEAVTKELQPVEERLAKLREELENLKAQLTSSTSVENAIKIANIQDEISKAEAFRRTYNDFLTKLSLNEILQQGTLQLVYPATVPSVPSRPKLSNNLLISGVVGLFLGLGVAGILNRKQILSPTQENR